MTEHDEHAPMTDDELREIEARLMALHEQTLLFVKENGRTFIYGDKARAFFQRAPDDVARLLTEVRRLRAESEDAEEPHGAVPADKLRAGRMVVTFDNQILNPIGKPSPTFRVGQRVRVPHLADAWRGGYGVVEAVRMNGKLVIVRSDWDTQQVDAFYAVLVEAVD